MVIATCRRWNMVGGGNAYSVMFRVADKPTRPLHDNGHYATEIVEDGTHYYETTNAIMPKSHYTMPAGLDKWTDYKRLERKADRLTARIAKRAFPELAAAKIRKLSALWYTTKSLPPTNVEITVNMELPQ